MLNDLSSLNNEKYRIGADILTSAPSTNTHALNKKPFFMP